MKLHQTECLIVGAGPAGVSAALWLDHFKVPFLLLERNDRLGGEISRINLPIRNYLGLSAVNGADFLNCVHDDLERVRPSVQFGVDVTLVDAAAKLVESRGGDYRARSIILATGLRRRALDLVDAKRFRGRGLTNSGTRDLERIAGRPVAVVGGGDGALENALILAEHCPRVYVVHRGAAPDARQAFVDQVEAHPRIELVLRARVVELRGGGDALTAVALETADGARSLEVAWLVVKIGFSPNTDCLVPGQLETDVNGYLIVDPYLHASLPGVLAVGDVRNPRSPCIAAAVGDGAVAAREVYDYLSRVG